jgi:hypothetical protein
MSNNVNRDIDILKPFLRHRAISAGFTERELKSRAFTQLVWGVHVSSEVPIDNYILCKAALLAVPEGAICGRSAARLWGAIVPDSADVEILLNRKQRTLIKGLRMHRPAQPPPTTMRYGLRVTTPEATFLKLAGELELVDLVVAGDTLCKKATTPQKLVAAAAAFRGKRARLAREAAALVRSRVDSPQETKVRLLMVLAGIPEPTVNIVFRDEEGSIKRRIDMGYRKLRLGVEYDGRQHAENDEQWQNDIDRREEFDELEWRLIILRSPDLFVRPDLALARVARALASKGVIVHLKQDWRRHFPVRRAAA